MAPSVLVHGATGDVRVVLGAAGGTKIPSAVAGVLLHNLYFGRDIKQAVDQRRMHHQLFPMEAMFEEGFNKVSTFLLSHENYILQYCMWSL